MRIIKVRTRVAVRKDKSYDITLYAMSIYVDLIDISNKMSAPNGSACKLVCTSYTRVHMYVYTD